MVREATPARPGQHRTPRGGKLATLVTCPRCGQQGNLYLMLVMHGTGVMPCPARSGVIAYTEFRRADR